MLSRFAAAATLSVGLLGIAAPHALASYVSWGTLSAYEGSTLVAQGKGTAGVDFERDVIGGHVTSRDPRPGGSPAYAVIQYAYEQPSPTGPYTLRGPDNATSLWVDAWKANNLNTYYTQARMWGKACQNDKLGPDACRQSGDFNQKW